jgi:hypothetical protein
MEAFLADDLIVSACPAFPENGCDVAARRPEKAHRTRSEAIPSQPGSKSGSARFERKG